MAWRVIPREEELPQLRIVSIPSTQGQGFAPHSLSPLGTFGGRGLRPAKYAGPRRAGLLAVLGTCTPRHSPAPAPAVRRRCRCAPGASVQQAVSPLRSIPGAKRKGRRAPGPLAPARAQANGVQVYRRQRTAAYTSTGSPVPACPGGQARASGALATCASTSRQCSARQAKLVETFGHLGVWVRRPRRSKDLRSFGRLGQETQTQQDAAKYAGLRSAALDQRWSYARRTGCHARRSEAWRPAVRQASGSGDPDAARTQTQQVPEGDPDAASFLL